MGRYRLPGHRSGAHLRDDRKPAQCTDLARDGEKSAPASRSRARWVLGGLAHRIEVSTSGARPPWQWAALLAAIAVLLLATGCSRPSSDQAVLRFWAMGREGEVVVELLPEFERTHPGVHVQVQQLPWSAAHEKLLTAFAGDATPDICQLGNTWIAEFVALNALEPLDRYAAASPVVDLRDYFSGILDTNRLNGVLFGVPWYIDTRLLFYRRDLLAQAGFAEPPVSWGEWTRMLAAIKQRAGTQRYS